MPPFRFIAAAPPSAEENLALDETLLAEGNGVLRFWETPAECVVLGHSGRPERDLDVEACRRMGVPILRRRSGGGAVLLGPGCLNYALVLPLDWNPRLRDVSYSLRWTMERMAAALPGATVEGDCDLVYQGRKVSGNAQRRTQTAILQHGTLLYNFDVTRPELFLKIPHRAPRYRAGRSHRDFMGNLPFSAEELRTLLREVWC